MKRTLLLIALAGCASAGGAPEETTARQATIYSGPETGIMLADRPRATTAVIAAAPALVWLGVKKVYTDLGVPVTVENTTTHQIGNANFYKSNQFAGQSMAALVDCGSGMTGPKAATYRIYMSLLTSVVTDGKGATNLQTTFVPMGQDIAGGSSDKIPCGTTGRLESLFIERVKAEVGAR